MRKVKNAFIILLAVLLTTPLVGVAFAEESAPDDYVISRKRTQSDEGLTVTLPENSEVTLTADEPLVSKGFLAVTLTVKSVEHAAGDTYAPIIFSVNGAVVAGENMADEEHELVQNALDKSGKYPFAVEQKWGNYFFFPSGFLESTLYLPCASGTAVTSLTLTTDATHRSVLKIEKITTASEVLGTGEGEFSLSRFAEDLLAFMDLHHIEKAHLLGFSDGGNIALLFALRYPHRVEKLILNGANLYLKGLRKSVIEGCKSAYDEALPKAEADPAAKRTVNMMRLILQEPNIAPKALCSLPMPTLVIAGTKDMILCRHTKMIARHIPRARLVLMEGDHFIAQKHPEAFNRHVLDFLRES